MAAASGRDLILQIDTGSGYVAIAGVRSKSISINNDPVDITSDDDDGWRKLLPEPGQRGIDLSVSGVTKDQILCAEIMAATSSITLQNLKIIYPDGSNYLGSYCLSGFSNTAEYNGAVVFDASFQSANLTGNLEAQWLEVGMTSAWLLDETSGTEFSPTIGSNDLTATIGVVLNQSITGYSRVGVDFSGGESDLDGVEADFNTTGEKFSFTALIETGSSVAGIQTLCFVSGSSGNTFNFYIDAGQLKFQNYGSGIFSSGLTVSANTVYKVGAVMTDSPDILTIYLDSSKYEGVEAGTNGDYGVFDFAKIGNATGEGSFYFLGVISCPAVSTTALTEAQINTIFNSY